MMHHGLPEIQHVIQHTSNSCIFASMEMIDRLHRPDDYLDQRQIRSAVEYHRDGLSLHSEFRQWVRMGYLPRLHHTTELCDVIGKVCLMTVPSLNNVAGNHRIVVDMREEHLIYDPNKGRGEGEDGLYIHWYAGMADLDGWSEITFVEDCRRALP